MRFTKRQIVLFIFRHPFQSSAALWSALGPGFWAELPPETRRFFVFLGVGFLLSLGFISYHIYASSGLPLWKRLLPWVLMYEYLGKQQLTTFEKVHLINVIVLSAVIIVGIKQSWKLTFHLLEISFGILTPGTSSPSK